MDATFELDGFDILERQLAELEVVAQKRILRKAVAEAAEPIRATMLANYRQHWGSDTGQLDESIRTRVSVPRNPTWADVVASVGVFKVRKIQKLAGKDIDAPVYAYWLEHGTRPHSLASAASLKKYSTGAKRREHKRIDRPDQSAGLQHPGIIAKPFIRPAFDINVERALEIEKTTLSIAIDQAIRRASR